MTEKSDGNGNGTDDPFKKGPNLIVIPGGKKISSSDIGAEYVIKSTKDVPLNDIVDPVDISEETNRRDKFVREDILARAAIDRVPTGEIISLLIREITEELAHLKFERRKAAEEGKNTANYSVGRMNSLRSLADLMLKCREADKAEVFDLKSVKFQSVFKLWMEFFNEAMVKVGIREPDIDLVFQQMKADMVDWEKRMTDVR